MTAEELNKIATEEQEKQQALKHKIHVCVAAGCVSSHSDQVKAALEQQVKDRGLTDVQVKGVGCMGLCAEGPLVEVKPAGVMYRNVKAEDARELIDSVQQEKPVDRL